MQIIYVEHPKSIGFINYEGLESTTKAELAKLHSLKYLLVVVNGTDQSTYTLPHFTVDIREQREHGMRVHFIVLIHLAHKPTLQLYTMKGEHDKGWSQIVEVIHRITDKLNKEGYLTTKVLI